MDKSWFFTPEMGAQLRMAIGRIEDNWVIDVELWVAHDVLDGQ
jgi:hypothetical protein